MTTSHMRCGVVLLSVVWLYSCDERQTHMIRSDGQWVAFVRKGWIPQSLPPCADATLEFDLDTNACWVTIRCADGIAAARSHYGKSIDTRWVLKQAGDVEAVLECDLAATAASARQRLSAARERAASERVDAARERP